MGGVAPDDGPVGLEPRHCVPAGVDAFPADQEFLGRDVPAPVPVARRRKPVERRGFVLARQVEDPAVVGVLLSSSGVSDAAGRSPRQPAVAASAPAPRWRNFLRETIDGRR